MEPELTFDGGCQISAAVGRTEPAPRINPPFEENPYRAAIRRAILRFGWTLAGGEEGVDEIVNAVLSVPNPEIEDLRAEIARLQDRCGVIPVRVFRLIESPHVQQWAAQNEQDLYRLREEKWEFLSGDGKWRASHCTMGQMISSGYKFEEVTGNGE